MQLVLTKQSPWSMESFCILLVTVFLVQVFGYDPNYRNIFYQTTEEVQNQPLSDIQGEVPKWIEGDFVRQSCASYGDIDVKDLNAEERALNATQKSEKEDEQMGDDIQLFKDDNSDGKSSKRVVSSRINRWPYDKPVYYSFDKVPEENFKSNVEEAIKLIKRYTCIQFQEVERNDEQKFHVNFVDSGIFGKADSKVGMTKSQFGRSKFMQDTQLPTRPSVRTIIHEIMHNLGFIHEQERPDRDEFIDVYYDNIKKGKDKNFAKEVDAITFGEPYDFNSIMHYERNFFGKEAYTVVEDGSTKKIKLTTMSAKEEYGGGARKIGSTGSLTTSDIIRLNKLFRCDVPRQADLQEALAKLKSKKQSELIEESKQEDIQGGPCEKFKDLHGTD